NNQGNLRDLIVFSVSSNSDFGYDRDIMYKIFFDMRNDINDLKRLTLDILKNDEIDDLQEENHKLLEKIYKEQHGASNV
ncbi:sigma-54-dependent Fis family transcriptional regulator, partial [Polaribacter sp. MF5-112]